MSSQGKDFIQNPTPLHQLINLLEYNMFNFFGWEILICIFSFVYYLLIIILVSFLSSYDKYNEINAPNLSLYYIIMWKSSWDIFFEWVNLIWKLILFFSKYIMWELKLDFFTTYKLNKYIMWKSKLRFF